MPFSIKNLLEFGIFSNHFFCNEQKFLSGEKSTQKMIDLVFIRKNQKLFIIANIGIVKAFLKICIVRCN